jgi:hypothetical protein
MSAKVRRCEDRSLLHSVAALLVAWLSPVTTFGPSVPGVLMHARVLDGRLQQKRP